MLSGQAQVKAKSIKYLNGGKFELILTDVEPNDIMELLSCSGKYVAFKFGETLKTDRGYEDQPENGRLFTTDGSGVVQSVEPQDETTGEETISEPAGIYVCEACGLHVGELRGNDDDICPECQGKLIYHDCASEDTEVEVDESIPAEPEPEDVVNETANSADDPGDITDEPEMTEETLETAESA